MKRAYHGVNPHNNTADHSLWWWIWPEQSAKARRALWLVNNDEHCKVVTDVARTVIDPEKVVTRSRPKMGSEDFADMLHAVPGAYFWLGHDGSVPVHNPAYVLDDKILPIGASMFARIVENRLPAGRHA